MMSQMCHCSWLYFVEVAAAATLNDKHRCTDVLALKICECILLSATREKVIFSPTFGRSS